MLWKIRGAAGVAAILLACSACSTTDPNQVIGPFAAATQNATAAIKAYDQAAAQRLTALDIAKVTGDPAHAAVAVVPMPNRCATSSSDSELAYPPAPTAHP